MKKSLKTLLALCAIAVLSAGCALTACGKTADHYDKITKTLKLTKSFEGKVLESDDGIEEVTLPGSTTDGDTTNFELSSGGFVTVRYQGVNTPESTGAVEKWGKAASIFTDTQLKSATQIVLESPTGHAPDKDSVGGRSLCYVWYKTETDDFKLLNLELVENGYSLNKENAEYPYYSYFQKAEKFAKGKKLRLHNPKLEDPLFNTEVQTISLKDFNEHPENFAENMKVHLHAYVSNKTTASSNAVTYQISQYDEATNTAYSIQMYAGFVKSAWNLNVGDLYHIVGTLQKYGDTWQIAGISYDRDYMGKEESEHSWRVQSAYYLIFDDTNALYKNVANGSDNCFGKVTVGTVTLTGSTLTFTGTADLGETPPVEKTFTFKVTVPADYVAGTIAEGNQLRIKGCYQFTKDSNELTIANYTDIAKI